MAKARQYAQSYTSIFGSEVPPSYIDLGSFAGLVKKVGGGGALSQAADGVIAAIQNAVIAEKHGPNKPGSTGVSIYFPTSQLYGNAAAGPQSYVPVARRFAENSLWDEFLAYFYTGKQFEPQTKGPTIPAGVTRAPGTTRHPGRADPGDVDEHGAGQADHTHRRDQRQGYRLHLLLHRLLR